MIIDDLPLKLASCNGVERSSGGLTQAPASSKILTHSILPPALASHKGVELSMLWTFT